MHQASPSLSIQVIAADGFTIEQQEQPANHHNNNGPAAKYQQRGGRRRDRSPQLSAASPSIGASLLRSPSHSPSLSRSATPPTANVSRSSYETILPNRVVNNNNNKSMDATIEKRSSPLQSHVRFVSFDVDTPDVAALTSEPTHMKSASVRLSGFVYNEDPAVSDEEVLAESLSEVEEPPPVIDFTPSDIIESEPQGGCVLVHQVQLIPIVLPEPPRIPTLSERKQDGTRQMAKKTKVAVTARDVSDRPLAYRPVLPTKLFWNGWFAWWTAVFVLCIILHFAFITIGSFSNPNSDDPTAYNIAAHVIELIALFILIPWNYHQRYHSNLAFNARQPVQLLLITVAVGMTEIMVFYDMHSSYIIDNWWELGMLFTIWSCTFCAFLVSVIVMIICIALESYALFNQLEQVTGGVQKVLFTYTHTHEVFHDMYRRNLIESEKQNTRLAKLYKSAREELERELQNPRHEVTVGDALLLEDHQTLLQAHEEQLKRLNEVSAERDRLEEELKMTRENLLAREEELRTTKLESAHKVQELKSALIEAQSKIESNELTYTEERAELDRQKQIEYAATLTQHQAALQEMQTTIYSKQQLQSKALDELRTNHASQMDCLREELRVHYTLAATTARKAYERDIQTLVADHDFRFRALEDKHRALQVVYEELQLEREADRLDATSVQAMRLELSAAKERSLTWDQKMAEAKEELERMEEVIRLQESMLDSYEHRLPNFKGSHNDRGASLSALSTLGTNADSPRMSNEEMARSVQANLRLNLQMQAALAKFNKDKVSPPGAANIKEPSIAGSTARTDDSIVSERSGHGAISIRSTSDASLNHDFPILEHQHLTKTYDSSVPIMGVPIRSQPITSPLHAAGSAIAGRQ